MAFWAALMLSVGIFFERKGFFEISSASTA